MGGCLLQPDVFQAMNRMVLLFALANLLKADLPRLWKLPVVEDLLSRTL